MNTTYTLLEIQTKITEIIFDLDKIFSENKITYYLMGGSALGAVRHSGFIPWDDDLDIFVMYDDLITIKNLGNKMGEKFYYEEGLKKNPPDPCSKIKVKGTTYLEKGAKIENGDHRFFIDVMPLINVSNNFITRRIQYIAAKMLVLKSLSNKEYYTKSKIKNIIIKIANCYMNKKKQEKFLKFVLKYNKSKTTYVAHFFGRAKYRTGLYKAKWFKTQKYIDFNNIKLPIMNGYDMYLKKRYGNKYMAPPSSRVIKKYPSHLLYANLEKDYTEIDLRSID